MVAEGESVWLPEDAQAILGYLREKAMTCPGCGHPRDETMDPESEGHWRSRAMVCHACAARERKAGLGGGRATPGQYFTVERDG